MNSIGQCCSVERLSVTALAWYWEQWKIVWRMLFCHLLAQGGILNNKFLFTKDLWAQRTFGQQKCIIHNYECEWKPDCSELNYNVIYSFDISLGICYYSILKNKNCKYYFLAVFLLGAHLMSRDQPGCKTWIGMWIMKSPHPTKFRILWIRSFVSTHYLGREQPQNWIQVQILKPTKI